MDDYVAFILGQGTGKGSAANDDAKGAAKPKDAKAARQEAARAREAQAALRKQLGGAVKDGAAQQNALASAASGRANIEDARTARPTSAPDIAHRAR